MLHTTVRSRPEMVMSNLVAYIMTLQNPRPAGPLDHVSPHSYKILTFLCALFSDLIPFFWQSRVSWSPDRDMRVTSIIIIIYGLLIIESWGDAQTATNASDQTSTLSVKYKCWTVLTKTYGYLKIFPVNIKIQCIPREHKLVKMWTRKNLYT